MSLLAQFQTFIGSFFIGGIYMFLWTLFNRIFYHHKIWFIRLIAEICLMCAMAFCYYYFISYYAEGVVNIFYFVGLISGAFIYMKFYAVHFEYLFERVAFFLNRHLLSPVKLKMKQISVKLKRHRNKEKTNGKKIKKNKSTH